MKLNPFGTRARFNRAVLILEVYVAGVLTGGVLFMWWYR